MMKKDRGLLFKIVQYAIMAIALVVLLDTGLGAYRYSDAQSGCNQHMMYNIPGRGRLTDDPYSSSELELIRLDCRAHGLNAQLDSLRLPFNQSRIRSKLATVKAECAAVPSYTFSWGCAIEPG